MTDEQCTTATGAADGTNAAHGTSVPIACTLTPTQYRHRVAEIAALSRDALRSVEQRDHVLHLRYAPEALERVRTLVSQERTCCAFLGFDLREGCDDVQLTVTVPPAARDAVPELLTELTGGDTHRRALRDHLAEPQLHWHLVDAASRHASCVSHAMRDGGVEILVTVGETLHSSLTLPDEPQARAYVDDLLQAYLDIGWRHAPMSGAG